MQPWEQLTHWIWNPDWDAAAGAAPGVFYFRKEIHLTQRPSRAR